MTARRKNVNIVESLRNGSRTRADAERRLAEFGMGVLNALIEDRMSLQEAQRDLFNMDSYQNVRRFRFSRDLAEFLLWGMELEDVADLAPDGRGESYGKMKQLIRRVLEGSRRAAAKRTVRALNAAKQAEASGP